MFDIVDNLFSSGDGRNKESVRRMGANSAIKRYSAWERGVQPQLFCEDRFESTAIADLLRTPWVSRGSQLVREDGSCSCRHVEEPVDVAWDRSRARPAAFVRSGVMYVVDSVAQTWSSSRFWWSSDRYVARRFWRVLAEGGVYDLVFDETTRSWLLVGIQD